jgi:NAD(P)-dependent dehydrogenase (short-subunit alcohol dehydrogenase family)
MSLGEYPQLRATSVAVTLGKLARLSVPVISPARATTSVRISVRCRTPYSAAKAALEACTRIWANELASTGITVNAVAPGPTETEMYRERSPIGSERETRFLETIPLHRVGTPREIAHAICALLDEDAGYITGQIVRADGGGSIAA